jgi:NADH:ubiquinone reductase (H+-translocating)
MADQGDASTSGAPKVVIIGGGFAGLFAARALRRSKVSVTLVDRSEHHLFQPLLYQCATGILSEGQIALPLRSLMRRHRNIDFTLAEVTGFNVEDRYVIASLPGGTTIRFPYDHLIVAAGVRQSYFGHDEFAAYAPGMKTLTDALAIRQRVFGAFEMAESTADPDERARWLTFAMVGAGPTGVELAGQIRELATTTLRKEYRHIKPEDARVILFDGGSEPLAAFGPKLAAKAKQSLDKLGVELAMNTVVTDISVRGLLAKSHDGTVAHHSAATVLWTAGVEAPPLAHMLATATGATQDRAGRIEVGPDLTIAGFPEIVVVGDLMSLDKLPGLAEVAMQSGYYAGRRVRRSTKGETSAAKPFKYHDLGSAAYIARGRAVVKAGPLNLSGFLGWVTWIVIHIGFLTGFRNRVTALLTWVIALSSGVRRERVYTVEQINRLSAVYSGHFAEPLQVDEATVEPTPGL